MIFQSWIEKRELPFNLPNSKQFTRGKLKSSWKKFIKADELEGLDFLELSGFHHLKWTGSLVFNHYTTLNALFNNVCDIKKENGKSTLINLAKKIFTNVDEVLQYNTEEELSNYLKNRNVVKYCYVKNVFEANLTRNMDIIVKNNLSIPGTIYHFYILLDEFWKREIDEIDGIVPIYYEYNEKRM